MNYNGLLTHGQPTIKKLSLYHGPVYCLIISDIVYIVILKHLIVVVKHSFDNSCVNM